MAAGSCCDVGKDAYGEENIIKDSECLNKKNYPLYVPKNNSHAFDLEKIT